MRLLVTGGAGFIGSNFVRRIVNGTYPGVSQLTVLDKLTYAGTLKNLEMLPKESFEFIKGDITNPDLISDLTKRHDAIVNFAAESHVDRSITGARDFIETNVLGVQNLLAASLHNKVSVFVQVSTDEVYGSISEGSWSEEYPLLPNSPYSASKASADLICRSYNRTFGMDIRVTRCSNNYGPHQFPEKVIPLFVTNLIDNEHCDGIYSVLSEGKSGNIYNIGGGRELTNRELTEIILRKFDRDESSIEYVTDRLGHDLRYSVSHEKITRELGYMPKINFEDGIEETIEWYKRNESWWRPLKK